MKEKIKRILQQMQRFINNKQLIKLEHILISVLGSPNSNNTNITNSELISIFIDAKKLEGCSFKSLLYYQSLLTNATNAISKPINEIETSDLRNYLSKYQQTNNSSNVTIDNIRRVLSSFFAWLEDENYIIKSPCRRIKKVKAPITIKETYSDEELETIKSGISTKRDVAIVNLLSSTGMRIGELVNLNISDVNFYERECLVLGKGNKQRIVYFDARSKLSLKEYLESRNDYNHALFVTLRSPHKRVSINAIESRLRKIGKIFNIQKLHPHKFRRTLATMAIDKGMPLSGKRRNWTSTKAFRSWKSWYNFEVCYGQTIKCQDCS
nr:tyrosine-type recombinase/integrase [Mycoplasmopsis bovis]